MIISRRRQFIFLHTPKTAGSSVSLALARDMAPDDIMIGCWSDAFRHHIPYNRFALSIAKKNKIGYACSRFKNLIRTGKFVPKSGFVNRQIKSYFRKHYGFFADAHTPAKIVRDYDPQLWDDAFKFAFVRNPWSHAVSSYKWCTRGLPPQQRISFREFLCRVDDTNRPDPEGVRPPIISNWDVYTIDGNIAVNYIGRYEQIDAELEKISKQLGFSVSVNALCAKGNVRSKTKCIATYYDEQSVELVRKLYRNEIDAFSYTVPF